MPTFLTIGDGIRCSAFSTAEGCDEVFISIATPVGVSFSDALAESAGSYHTALDRIGLPMRRPSSAAYF